MSEEEEKVKADAAAAAFVDAALKAEKKQADILVDIAMRGKLFRTPDGAPFADVFRANHRETHPVRSAWFRDHLLLCYCEENADSAPGREAISTATNVIEAKARFKGEEHPVAVRIGRADDKIYIDICDNNWRAIEIDAEGWRVVDESPIRFIRSSGMLPLPEPKRAGKTKDGIDALRKFVNIKPGADFALLKAWVLGAFYDHGPYTILALIARHGAAKSTILRILRDLIDPNSAPLRSPPRNADDLYIAATKSQLVLLDNLSSIPEWLSDALCRICTGMSHAKRMLYTDQDEVLISACRPIALTSVVEVIETGDLGDRCITLVPPKIEDDSRRQEAEVLAEFEKERPAIFAAFLDAMSHGLRTLPDMPKKKWPRMADFARWADACEGAHDTPGTFLKAYSENRLRSVRTLLGDNLVAVTLRRLVLPFTGNSVTLLDALTQLAGEQAKTKDWPKTPKMLSTVLRRLVPLLHDVGIEAEPPGETDKTRTWYIWKPEKPEPPDRPEQPDDKPLKSQGLGDVGGLGGSLHTTGVGEPGGMDGLTPAECNKPPEPHQPPAASKNGNGANRLGPNGGRADGRAVADDCTEPPDGGADDADAAAHPSATQKGALTDIEAAYQELAEREAGSTSGRCIYCGEKGVEPLLHHNGLRFHRSCRLQCNMEMPA